MPTIDVRIESDAQVDEVLIERALGTTFRDTCFTVTALPAPGPDAICGRDLAEQVVTRLEHDECPSSARAYRIAVLRLLGMLVDSARKAAGDG